MVKIIRFIMSLLIAFLALVPIIDGLSEGYIYEWPGRLILALAFLNIAWLIFPITKRVFWKIELLYTQFSLAVVVLIAWIVFYFLGIRAFREDPDLFLWHFRLTENQLLFQLKSVTFTCFLAMIIFGIIIWRVKQLTKKKDFPESKEKIDNGEKV